MDSLPNSTIRFSNGRGCPILANSCIVARGEQISRTQPTRFSSLDEGLHEGDCPSEGARLQPCHPSSQEQRGFSLRGKPQISPHSTKSQTSSNRQSRSRAKALHADALRSIFPMDCSRWKALPSGRRRLRRTTTASPNFLILQAANNQEPTGETLKLSLAANLAATL